MFEEDQIEREIFERIVNAYGNERDALLVEVDRAIALRLQRQGPSHPDLIWPMSLKIELLRKQMDEDQPALLELAEERLRLRRAALPNAPCEIWVSLRELMHLYMYEDVVTDAKRFAELEREALALRPQCADRGADGW